MANATLKSILERKKKELEAQTQERNVSQETSEESTQTAPLADEEHQEIQTESEQAQGREQESEHETNKEEQEDKEDYKRKFQRASGKISSLEKRSNQAEKEAERLRKEIAKLEIELEKSTKDTEKSTPKNVENTEDDFEWMEDEEDENEKNTLKSSKPQKLTPSKTDDLDERIENAFAQREAKAREKKFIKELDNVVSSLGEQSSFIEVANEPDFNNFITQSRAKLAIFNSALNYQDEESVALLKEILTQYLGKNKETTVSKNVPVKPQNNAVKSNKAKTITYEQYQKAVREKGIASKRNKAREVINAWRKQENQ